MGAREHGKRRSEDTAGETGGFPRCSQTTGEERKEKELVPRTSPKRKSIVAKGRSKTDEMGEKRSEERKNPQTVGEKKVRWRKQDRTQTNLRKKKRVNTYKAASTQTNYLKNLVGGDFCDH